MAVMADVEWPWQYDFPPFFTIQPHLETQNKQLTAWQSLIVAYFKSTKSSVLDIRESQNTPLFNNAKINRKLPQEGILKILEHLAKSGHAEPCDKSRNRWYIYWHTLEEWAAIIYDWAQNNGMINSVCTLYELVSGDNTADEEFYGLDTEVLLKALRILERTKKAEIIMFDENEGVKFL